MLWLLTWWFSLFEWIMYIHWVYNFSIQSRLLLHADLLRRSKQQTLCYVELLYQTSVFCFLVLSFVYRRVQIVKWIVCCRNYWNHKLLRYFCRAVECGRFDPLSACIFSNIPYLFILYYEIAYQQWNKVQIIPAVLVIHHSLYINTGHKQLKKTVNKTPL